MTITLNIFPQNKSEAVYRVVEMGSNLCSQLLGRSLPLPPGFIRVDRNIYQAKEPSMLAIIENGSVVWCGFSIAGMDFVQASEYRGIAFNVLENNNWRYYGSSRNDGSPIYFKNGIYSNITYPFGSSTLAVAFVFSRDINILLHYTSEMR